MDVMPMVSTASGNLAEPELESLSGRVRRGDKNAIPALAKQFESVFMAQMVKEMRQTLEPGTLFGNDPADVYGGMFDLFIGKYLAKAGGIGLAKMLEKHLQGAEVGHAGTKTSTPKNTPWEPKQRHLLKTA